MKTCSSYMAMVVVQLAYGGSNILMKIALEEGLNQLVFVVYRHIIAMLLLGPLAYVLERKQRPSLTFSVIMKIFVLASLGTTIHLNVYYAGLEYTSPTVASALSNVIPGLTFLLAVLLRMEKVKLGSAGGRAKVLGTLISIGSVSELRHVKENWIKGSALILISHFAWSAWLILQAVVYKIYPARLSLNTLICFFATLQSSFLALFFGRNPTIWRLEWNVKLLTIVYCGVVISALVYYLQTWCISNKGPVFAAMFSPLLLVIVGIFSVVAFAERLHLGSSLYLLMTQSSLTLCAFGLCLAWSEHFSSSSDFIACCGERGRTVLLKDHARAERA
ncbi:hypothetical protein F0562_007851 [Nyssa sinensis]|uniref:WAT1-related protein n=1 Tax=Nyssa sinensis TaxID=561372 RepID=A0A5J5A721_9ASTE|nr:hypothetical protein F0562_007851 [Nyssa sinensis]